MICCIVQQKVVHVIAVDVKNGVQTLRYDHSQSALRCVARQSWSWPHDRWASCRVLPIRYTDLTVVTSCCVYDCTNRVKNGMPAMGLFCYIFFSFSLFFVISALPNSTSIFFSYITTITGAGFRSGGAIPVVDLALEQINNRTDILPNYTLSYRTIHDSKVKQIFM